MTKTIAIVEDEPAVRDNYAELFRRQGYRVETCADRATARDNDNEIDTVAGLRVRADDYVTRDVSPHQLGARVGALFRRVEAVRSMQHGGRVITQGPLQLKPEQMHLLWRDRTVALTMTGLWILHALVQLPGHVKSRQQLMKAADTYVDLATIASPIKRIRRKLQQVDPAFDAIESVYGPGYRWVPQG